MCPFLVHHFFPCFHDTLTLFSQCRPARPRVHCIFSLYVFMIDFFPIPPRAD